MDYKIMKSFKTLGFDDKVPFSRVERLYRQRKMQYNDKIITDDEWNIIEDAYLNINKYYDELDETVSRDEQLQKKVFLFELGNAYSKYKDDNKKEQVFPLVKVLDDLKEEKDLTSRFYRDEDFLSYVGNSIREVLDEKDRELFDTFIRNFLMMWNIIYGEICRCEYDLFIHGNLDLDARFSVGMDELTLPRYEYGIFKGLFEVARSYARYFGENNNYHFMSALISLMASYHGFLFEETQYGRCPIYSFKTSTRLIEFKQDYFDMFDEERRTGLRTSPYVNQEELLDFVEKKLRLCNKQAEEREHYKIS